LLTGYTPHLAQSAFIANSRGAKKKNAPPSELTEDANKSQREPSAYPKANSRRTLIKAMHA
jgi:hypothetical protein